MRKLIQRLGLLRILVVFSSFCLVGCTGVREYIHNGFKVGPNYQPPAVPVADEWIDSRSERFSKQAPDLKDWWSVFNDPVLNRLIQTAYEQNISLREAGFRVAEAQARRGVAVGQLFPQVQDVSLDFVRTQRSTEVALFPNVDSSSPFANLASTRFNNWRIGSSLAWELDFWGRFRRSVEAADAQLDSSVFGYDEVLVMLIGQVATAYIELRTEEERLAVAKKNAELQTESTRVAKARFDAKGEGSELDYPQAKANLGSTLADIERIEIRRREAQNRLSVLMGMPPHDLSDIINSPAPIPKAPGTVTVGIPAELIWRRPDVRRAERIVAAQSAEIGVATSALYPHISVLGSLGWEAGKFSDVFKSSAFGGTIGPSFRWEVLNYGRLLNNIKAENAVFQQVIANYQQTVLKANEEAENAIVAYLHLLDQVKLLETSVRDAREAERVAQVKYRAGETDFNRLFVVQQLLLGQEERLAVARGASAQSLVDLYRALGGGWEIRLARPVSPITPPGQVPLSIKKMGQDQPVVPDTGKAPMPTVPSPAKGNK
ncbi:MAG: TolC family protein [Gemmataceae bacterium]|nr:TolC family protein [Gemmataceae bacterium]